jgi:hypothetical protein
MALIRFTKFEGVPADQLGTVIASMTETEWDDLERGYIDGVAREIDEWWPQMLGLADDVDAALLFCQLYQLSLARTEGV